MYYAIEKKYIPYKPQLCGIYFQLAKIDKRWRRQAEQ